MCLEPSGLAYVQLLVEITITQHGDGERICYNADVDKLLVCAIVLGMCYYQFNKQEKLGLLQTKLEKKSTEFYACGLLSVSFCKLLKDI